MDSKREPKKLTYVCQVCNHFIFSSESAQKVLCDRCGHEVFRWNPRSARSSLAFSLTALILYFPANIYPFMTIEMYGSRNSTTIWQGVRTLAADGSIAIALIVFLASLLIPLVKILILFYLSLTPGIEKKPVFKTRLYQIVESIGRWSMLDIFLLAILIAIMKLGSWTAVKPEIGSYLFALVVIFTMLASASFDPHLLWKDKHGHLAK